MPRRSAVLSLPETLKAELDRRLVASGFAGYEQLSAWLAEHGQSIGKSSIHRYGEQFEQRIRSLKLVTEQARAIVAESPDHENAVGDALARLVQEKLFAVLMDLQVDPEQIDIHKIGRLIADLGRATISQKKWAAEARQAAIAEVKSKIDGLERSGTRTLDKETLRAIREEVYGLA